MPRMLGSSARPLILAITVAVSCTLAIKYATIVPEVVPASSPEVEFSAERAVRHVREIAQRPHPSGNSEHARVRQYLLRELAALRIPAQVQDTTGIGTRLPMVGRVQNVLGRLPGTQVGGPAVLLMAHYDGSIAGPGAGDNAAGVAAVLETLRALRAAGPLTNDVIALFTDGEEAGLIGAAAFTREHPWAKDASVVLNVEARGTHGPSLMVETGPGNLDVVQVLRGVRGVRAASIMTSIYRRVAYVTDLYELALLERPALNFAFVGGANRYHTSGDDVAHLDARSVQHHGTQMRALAQAFASGVLPRSVTPDAVYFDLPVVGLVVYPQSWAIPLAILGAALVSAAIELRRRRTPRWVRGLLFGMVGTILAATVAALAAAGVVTGVFRLHTALESGDPQWSALYAGGTVTLAFGVAVAAYAIARRWAPPTPLHVGALSVWALLSLGVTFADPGASYLFTCPSLVIASATLANLARPASVVTAVASAAAFAIAVFIIVPITYLTTVMGLGLEPMGATILAVVTALITWLLSPMLELWPERRWRMASIAGAATLVFFAVGAAIERTSARRPARSSLTYVVDADRGKAWLAGSGTPPARPWIRQAIGSGDDGASTPPAWVTRYFDERFLRSAPYTPVTPAMVTVLADAVTSNGRRMVLHVRPAPESVLIELNGAMSDVRSESVNGRLVDRSRHPDPSALWWLQYRAPTDDGFTVELVVAPTAKSIFLMSRHIGVPATAGIRVPHRPDGMLRVGSGDSTLVRQTIEF